MNLLYLPRIYLSGFFFPLPHSIHWIQFASPAFYLDQLALAAVGIASWSAPVSNVAVLVGVTLLLGLLAVKRLARVGHDGDLWGLLSCAIYFHLSLASQCFSP